MVGLAGFNELCNLPQLAALGGLLHGTVAGNSCNICSRVNLGFLSW